MDTNTAYARRLIDLLRAKGLTTGTAESCTGGNIAHTITAIAGASEVYNGSVVSYSNTVKHNVLGVSVEDLDQYGAVSEAVVRSMAAGACRVLGTDCAMATSGIAGPGGGSADKPVGTVWIAVHTPCGTRTRRAYFGGDRAHILDAATGAALKMLLDELAEQ